VAAEASRRVFELKAGGPADPDALRAATVLSAYFHAEHMRAFRRLLWRRLAVLAVAWALIGGLSSLFSARAVVDGLAVFGVIAIGAAVVEWQAAEHLTEVVGLQDPIVRSRRSFPPA
jgi:hypothetical protein